MMEEPKINSYKIIDERIKELENPVRLLELHRIHEEYKEKNFTLISIARIIEGIGIDSISKALAVKEHYDKNYKFKKEINMISNLSDVTMKENYPEYNLYKCEDNYTSEKVKEA